MGAPRYGTSATVRPPRGGSIIRPQGPSARSRHTARRPSLNIPSFITPLLLGVLVGAIVAVFVVQQKRYRRMHRRMKAGEQRASAIVQSLKPVYTARAETMFRAAGLTPRARPVFRSQFGEDLFLFELFFADAGHPKTDGYYIECGAYDGWTYAVTAVFDAMGWDGLLVEPIPALADSCRRARPHARVVQAALSTRGSSGFATFTQLTDTGNLRDACSFLDDARDRSRSKAPRTAHTAQVQVPLTTMDLVLEAQPPRSGQVDLAVIDVEGSELSLLDGFDLARWKPRVILIEDNALGRDSKLLDYLMARGYEQATWVYHNRLMIRREETELLQRVRDIAQHLATVGAPAG